MTKPQIQDHQHPFQHAFAGISYTYSHHSNLRTHLLIALLVTFFGLYFHLKSVDWLILIFTIILVIVCEMINTSLESLGDAITLQYSQEIKIAKDVAAGMVLISSFGAVIIGIIIFIPYL